MKNYKQKVVDHSKKDRTIKPPSVAEYMTSELITFNKDTEIREVINTLLERRISGAPVLNDKKEVVGLIDDKDCLNVLFSGMYYNHPVGKRTVETYMSNVMKSISVNDDIMEVANVFLHTKYKRLLVMDDNDKLVGQISRRDILKAIKAMNGNTW